MTTALFFYPGVTEKTRANNLTAGNAEACNEITARINSVSDQENLKIILSLTGSQCRSLL